MTERQEQILDAIHDFAQAHGYQPTVRDLMPMVGLDSTSTVHQHLANLRRMGLVDWVDGQVRTLHLVEQEEAA